MTQAALADTLGVSRQYMQQIEKGVKAPNRESVLALSEILGVGEQFFDRPVRHYISSEDINFRRLKTTTLSFQSQMAARASLLEEVINLVSEHIDLPEPSIPSYDCSDDANMDVVADRFRRDLDLGIDTPIHSVTRLLEVYGAVCVDAENVPEKISALSVDTLRPLVMNNADQNQPSRKRFNLAHELLHLICHRGRVTGDDLTEKQANAFASALLMPKRAFLNECPIRTTVRVSATTLQMLAPFKKEWGVSYAAIFRRAHDLGVISSVTYRNANVFLRKRGYFKQEPNEPENTETPETLAMSMGLLVDEFNIYATDIADQIGLSGDFLSSLLGVIGEKRPEDYDNVVSIRQFRQEKGARPM